MRLYASLVFLGLLGTMRVVNAAEGPCGIESGKWVTPSCTNPDTHEYASLEITRRTWLIYESHCAIRSAKLSGNKCNFRLACEAEGAAQIEHAAFEKVDDRTIIINNIVYRHCRS